VAGAEGDIMQLTINATGEGNSGGPVFNSSGKVIGMFTYGFISGTTRSTAAVPIKYGVDLFKAQ
jgi:S1-C subfamily serine protease